MFRRWNTIPSGSFFQVFIPILIPGTFAPDAVFSDSVNRLGKAIASFNSCAVMIEAKEDRFQIRVILQHLTGGAVCRRTQRNIGVLLPPRLIHADICEHIYRSFKYKKVLGFSDKMKAVFRNTACEVAFEVRHRRGGTLLRMARNAVRIVSDEYGVVVFDILINQPVAHKSCQHIAVYESLTDKIPVYAAHIGVLRRQCERQSFFLPWLAFRPTQFSSRVASKQTADGFGIGKSVKLSHEIDGTAADLLVLAVPFTAVDGDFA